MIIPLSDIAPRTLQRLSASLYDGLFAHCPAVEPDGPDAAFAQVWIEDAPRVKAELIRWSEEAFGQSPVIGVGPSKNAARALAECGLPPQRLADADARWLWLEDDKITARLYRLGLATFGDVAALGEAALVYQFGKTGRFLHQRSIGRDSNPIRALWPPPRAEAHLNFGMDAVEDEGSLRESLSRLAARLSREICSQGRHTRRISLTVRTEVGDQSADWTLPFPVQSAGDIFAALRRLRGQVRVASPIIFLSVLADDIDLPSATTGNLFDSRAAERKLSLDAARRRLRSRYGVKALRLLGEMAPPRREERRQLRRERLQA